jgi:hypothetical protein
MIKLICINPDCGYSYQVSKKELENYGQYHKTCLLCKSQLKVDNLEEIVRVDIDTEIRNNVDTYIKIFGIEGAWELIERNKNQACARLYFEEFKRRGIDLNGK